MGGGATTKYDQCFAAARVPADYGGNGTQRTPFCTYCETVLGYCRFCRGMHSCTPPTRTQHWSGIPGSMARQITPTQLEAVREVQRRLAERQTKPSDSKEQQQQR